MPDDASSELTRAEFIVQFVNDLARGELKALEEYYQCYPGYEDVISSEWNRLQQLVTHATVTEAAEPPTFPAPESESAEPASRFTALGRYRIERELGRGAQGTVYQAWDTALERRVALKVLKASWSGSSSMVRRFELEAQALARLEHPGIAAIHDAGSVRGLPYFAMRHVDGRSLAQDIAERSRTPTAVGRSEVLRYVTLIEHAARALHAAHEAGLVHRDVKPGNLMIKADGEPVLLDFGLALFREGGSSLTATGDILGTPAFMAPEQMTGEKGRVDRRADVYSLAATLHEALTRDVGRPKRADADPKSTFRARQPARRRNPAVSRDLDAVLRAALDPDPDRRYASAAAFADDLARVRAGQPVLVRPPSAIRGIVAWGRRSPAAAALSLIAPVALATGLVALALKNHEIERAAQALAEKGVEADAATRLARERFAEFRRLDDLRRIKDLEDRERDLWPPAPEQIAAMERWLADARDVTGRLPEHRNALTELRRRGVETPRQEPGDPDVERLIEHRRTLQAADDEMRSPETPAGRRGHLARVAAEAPKRIAAIESELASRPVYRFASVEDRWVHDNLAVLVTRLEALTGPSEHQGTVAAMRRRLDDARAVTATSLTTPADAWRSAVAAIADPKSDPAYGGLAIAPILGLVPIGRDPKSRLWEFAHVLSGTPPERNAAGELVMTPESSIVLVLVPGGSFRMGARMTSDDEERPVDNVDPFATPIESPDHAVALDPFLISKYEMTQGQWQRATAQNPSHHQPGRNWPGGYLPNLLHPVDNVSLEECEAALLRLGLVLPTEAQWERAARAGTTTPWWRGASIQDFLSDDNLADVTLSEATSANIGHDAERRDGWAGTAPVGSFSANPFGLHDVIGNVGEWCADEFDYYNAPALPHDGLLCALSLGSRVVKGGSFGADAAQARSAARTGNHPTLRSPAIGVRPALPLRSP